MPKALTSQLKHSDYIYASDRPTPPLASSLFPSNNTMHTDNSPTSPTTSTRGAVRANPLHRGEACLTCRRRKMKCDAAKPSCGPCSRVGKADECEYEESRFLATIARLEEQVQILQERIRDLESGGGASTTGSTFTAFLPGGVGGRRTPSDGSTGSPYPFAAPALPSLPNLQPPPATYHQPHAHHQQHQQFEQLPAIVTTPTHEQAPGQGIGGGLGLHTEIQPNILQRLLGLFMPHATSQFGLPASSTRILGTTPTAQALTEAACAVACAFAPRASGLGGYERTFFQRCEAALSRSAANLSLYDVQAMVVLAVQAFGAGRPLEGHRHLGAAVRVALAMGLHQRSNGSSESERETWWMVYRAERAWAFLSPTNSPVIVDEDVSTPFSPSISSTSPGTPYTVKQEYSTNANNNGYAPAGVQGLWSAPAYALDERQGMESAESLGAKSAAVGARAWELVKEARNGGEPSPHFWPSVTTTLAALDRLLIVLPMHAPSIALPSYTISALCALCALHDALNSREGAMKASRRLVGVLQSREVEWACVDGSVGWGMVQVEAVLRRGGDVGTLGVVGGAVERLGGWMGYLSAGSPMI